jgi:condensin complex subunit 1
VPVSSSSSSTADGCAFTRLTVGATLAELTSLEQLLSVMEAEEPFHEDIINKLWQAYSKGFFWFVRLGTDWRIPAPAGTPKDIPRFQRTGAIIVLGMLAVSKPEIVTDKVELLLKIGLGQLGKVKAICTSSKDG